MVRDAITPLRPVRLPLPPRDRGDCGAGKIDDRERPSPHIDAPPAAIAAFCKRWRIVELALFGSVLRDDFGPESDVDALVGFDGNTHYSLFDLDRMESEPGKIFGRKPVWTTARERVPELLAQLESLAPPDPDVSPDSE